MVDLVDADDGRGVRCGFEVVTSSEGESLSYSISCLAGVVAGGFAEAFLVAFVVVEVLAAVLGGRGVSL